MKQNQEWKKIRAILVRRKRWLILPFLGVLVLGGALCLILPNIYVSTATILIQNQQIPPAIVPSTVNTFAEQRIQTITQEIMSRSKILSLTKKYDLLPQKREKLTTEDLVEAIRKRLSITPINAEINKETQSRPVLLTIAFTLSYEDEEPKKAQAVANEIASFYMEKNLQSREKNARGTTKFLQEQLNQVKSEIDGLELKIAEYREAHLEALPEFTMLNMQHLEKLNADVSNLNLQMRSLEEQSIVLKGKLALLDPQSGNSERVLNASERRQQVELERAQLSSRYSENHPLVQAKKRELALLEEQDSDGYKDGKTRERLKELELKLADLKARYSDQHPAVLSTMREIETVKNSLEDKQLTTRETKANRSRHASSLSYVALQSELDKAAIAISSLKAEKERLEKQREEVYGKLHSAPQVSKEYNSLNTDYLIAKNHYNEIRQKLMTAQVSQGMEEGQLGENFEVVEPAFFPEKPSKPQRLAIMLIALVLASACSIGTASIREYADKCIHDRETVEELTGLAVICSIPSIVTLESVRRGKRRRAILAASALCACILSVIAFHILVMDLAVFYARLARFMHSRVFI